VALFGRRMEKLEEAAAGLPQAQVLLISGDVADRQGVNQAVQEVIAHFGPVDIVVNNAGTNTNPRSVADVDPNDWDRTVAINLTGAFNVIRAVLPGMRERRDGLIINISSIAGLRASKLSGAAYSASKHGMVALTHSLNEEEMDYNIRACVICPGEVNTPIIDLRPEPVSQERRAEMLQPEDVSAAALFVAGLPARVCIPELIIKPTNQIYR
jgi:NADP-dependent 3-hydroxy acid dehydrogenase YdfG